MVLVDPAEHAANGDNGTHSSIKVRQPKRILHFSDGVLEEYSTDEEDVADNAPKQEDLVDPATLTWGPWFWYKTWRAGASTLSVMDSMGEYLADFFGITSPKYYFELEEYKKNQAEIVKTQEESRGWSTNPIESETNVAMSEITHQPKPVDV